MYRIPTSMLNDAMVSYDIINPAIISQLAKALKAAYVEIDRLQSQLDSISTAQGGHISILEDHNLAASQSADIQNRDHVNTLWRAVVSRVDKNDKYT